MFITIASCGGSSGSASFTGTVAGTAFHPSGVISTSGTVAMSDRGAFCDLVAHEIEPKSSHYLVIHLLDVEDFGVKPITSPGTYPVVVTGAALPHQQASADFITVDANCTNPGGPTGSGGTVVLTKVDGGAYSGTFDIVFDSGDHVSGSFASAGCDPLLDWGVQPLTCG